MSRRKTIFRLLVGLLAGSAAIMLAAKLGIDSVQGEPYRMNLRRANGQAFVQFGRSDVNLVSPEFRVDMPLESSRVVVLRSHDGRYESGTVYELETAAQSYQSRGTPDLVVYRKVGRVGSQTAGGGRARFEGAVSELAGTD